MSSTKRMAPPKNVRLGRETLEDLRDQLRKRGQRPSIVVNGPRTSAELIEAMQIVEEYGPMCEAMYLMMAADERVVNSEREVLRGALDVLSGGRVRTIHMEAMLDAAARRVASEGFDVRLKKVIEQLRDDPARAETTVVLAAAVAAADSTIVPAESAVLDKMFDGLGIDQSRANELLASLDDDVKKEP
jgi:tellurite resistance protein